MNSRFMNSLNNMLGVCIFIIDKEVVGMNKFCILLKVHFVIDLINCALKIRRRSLRAFV